MSNIEARGYAHPEVLVSTDWVAAAPERSYRPHHRIERGHAALRLRPHPGGGATSTGPTDLNDQLRRDYITRDGFERLMSRIGATKDTTVVFYGDKNNWWACYAFWVFQLFGHTNARMMDGGRVKWEKEKRPVTRDVPIYPKTSYKAERAHPTPRIARFATKCWRTCRSRRQLVDVRSPEEYTGARMHMPDYPNEGALRGGHIPGAKSVPWATRHQSRRRHVQDRRGAEEDLRRGQAAVAVAADDRLLPHRRAQQPHLVRAEVPARLREHPQLRRQSGPSGATWSDVPIEK